MQVESPNQSGSLVRKMSWRTSALFSALVNFCSLMKIDLWELGPEIAAIRRLSVAAVNCLTLNLQNRTAVGPYSWLPVLSIVSAWKHLCAAKQRDTQGKKQRSILVLNSRN